WCADSESMRGDQSNCFGGPERRKRQRLPLHWNVYLFPGADASPLLSWTKDLSSSGFYCFVDKPFSPGEEKYCHIIIPPQGTSVPAASTSLHCRILILRVEAHSNGMYGLACRIEEYSVSRWKPQVPQPQSL